MTRHILRIDASLRHTDSITRGLLDRITARFTGATITTRDLSGGLPLIDETWIGANFTPPKDRSAAQNATLAYSDGLIDELKAADTLVLGLPIYNFTVPTAFKAWVDLVARVGLSFQYTDTGPVGLLTGKRAIVAIGSGGTKTGSDLDFATGYIRHILGFIGITDVTFIAADALMVDADIALAAAHSQIDTLAA